MAAHLLALRLQVLPSWWAQNLEVGFSVSNVKNRLKTLKKRHIDAQKVLCQSGFGDNNSTQMLEAPPDVWETYLIVCRNLSSLFNYRALD